MIEPITGTNERYNMKLHTQILCAPKDSVKGGAPAPAPAAASGDAAAPVPGAVATTGPSPAMLALFQAPAAMPDLTKAERLTLPTLFVPKDVPVGGIVCGEIVKFMKSPVTTVKGLVMWLKNPNGQEFTFPVTGVIRSALAPDVDADNKDVLLKALAVHVGKTIYAKRTESKLSKKYDKDTFMFDVYLVKA